MASRQHKIYLAIKFSRRFCHCVKYRKGFLLPTTPKSSTRLHWKRNRTIKKYHKLHRIHSALSTVQCYQHTEIYYHHHQHLVLSCGRFSGEKTFVTTMKWLKRGKTHCPCNTQPYGCSLIHAN